MSRGSPSPYQRSAAGERPNGLYSQGSSARYNVNYDISADARNGAGGRDQRPGGYGGAGGGIYGGGSSGPLPSRPYRQPVNDFSRRPSHDTSLQDRTEDATRMVVGRDANMRRGMAQLEDVLNKIQKEWATMTDANCIPVQVALQLMDSSSLGRAHQADQFREIYQNLQEALKAVVKEHHEGFSSSVGLFHQIQASIQESQQKIRSLRDSLVGAKSNLSTIRPEFKRLAKSSQDYEDMLQILGQIEHLQLIPENLEARISEKRFLTAVDMLQDALRIAKSPELEGIGALADLRSYVANQETALVDILTEELHSHLYLKSPYSQDRWRYSVLTTTEGPDKAENGPSAVIPATKPIYLFLGNLDLSSPMLEDTVGNPEADNFYYIRLLLESFNKLGRLNVVVESIEQRMPTELFRLVDRTYTEIDQRHRNTGGLQPCRRKGGHGLSAQDDEGRQKIISDFLSTLYSKFEAIAEGHRVLHDVIEGMLKRENVKDTAPLTGGFKELWKLYQNEIRTILHDYLATDGHAAFRSGQDQPGPGKIFQRPQRDKNKMLFKLSNINNSAAELASAQEELNRILKLSVPGLVSDSRRPLRLAGNESGSHADISATGHKLLVEPSIFNMGYLLRPTLAFIRRLGDIVPSGSYIVTSSLTNFLDDFLLNVFQPQLDDTLTESSIQILIELDAFQAHPQWQSIAKRPIFKGTAALFSLITTFCKMLDTIPVDSAFTQPVINQMITYYDKCRGFYKSLVTRAQSQAETGIRLKTAAALSESDDIRVTVARLWEGAGDDRQQLLESETDLLVAYTQENPIEASSVISDRKSITSLCLLYTSMKWLASKLLRLRRVVELPAISSNASDSGQLAGHWGFYDAGRAESGSDSVYLPLTPETLGTFNATIASYQELAASVLFTLHMEMRCNIIFHINQSLESNYMLDQPINEADATILALNTDLVKFDEDVTTYLRPEEHQFITSGIGHLVDTLLVHNASRIKAMNALGCERMQLNLLVLQQNLKNIEPAVALARSAQYFDLFAAGPDAIVALTKAAREARGANGGSGGGGVNGVNNGNGADGGATATGGSGDDGATSATAAPTTTATAAAAAAATPGSSSSSSGQESSAADGANSSSINSSNNKEAAAAAMAAPMGTELPFSHVQLKFLVELCYSESLSSDRRDAAMQANRALNDHLLQLSGYTLQS